MRGWLAVVGLVLAATTLAGCRSESPLETVVLEVSSSPLVALRLVVRAGSAHEPPGKEGVAALTGLMLARAATTERSYGEILDRLYPTASSIDVRTDREVTVFETLVHRDHLDVLTDLFVEALTQPAFLDEDLERNRSHLAAELDAELRAEDELLGLELLQQVLFAEHPYGHAPAGTSRTLEALTVEDVRDFYRRLYTPERMLVGIGGGIPEGYAERLVERLVLPPSRAAPPEPIPPAPALAGRRVTLVRKPTTGVGTHLGFPLATGRGDEDFVPLLVAGTILGDHRTFHGRLMNELRNVRGLNYGDYAYVEHFHDPPETTVPTPNVPRSRQYFSIWLRPVAPENAPFAVRAALFELERLIADGVTEEEVEATSAYLLNRSRLWALDVSSRLGFELDGRLYGTPSLLDELEHRLPGLTAAEVNAAIAAHLQASDLEIVLVGGDTDALVATLDEEPAPLPDYPAPVVDAVARRDRAIAALDLDAAAMRVVPVEELFATPRPDGGRSVSR